MKPVSWTTHDLPLKRAERRMAEAGIPVDDHLILRENLATYLSRPESLSNRWEGKASRDLKAGYADADVFQRLHDLQDGLREVAEIVGPEATFWVAGGVSKGRAGAASDLDCLVDCSGLTPQQTEMVRNLPGWDSSRLNAYTPRPSPVPPAPGDWIVGNHYGCLAKESTLHGGGLPDIDLNIVGRSDGKFHPAQAKMGDEAVAFTGQQVLETDFLLSVFERRFESKGYRIEGNTVSLDGPVTRPDELEWSPPGFQAKK